MIEVFVDIACPTPRRLGCFVHATLEHALIRVDGTLTPGSVVTTLKNTVDHIVTEHGVAEMRGRSIAQRARALIAIADPQFRDGLTQEARALHYL